MTSKVVVSQEVSRRLLSQFFGTIWCALFLFQTKTCSRRRPLFFFLSFMLGIPLLLL